jgi:hypothetical protein
MPAAVGPSRSGRITKATSRHRPGHFHLHHTHHFHRRPPPGPGLSPLPSDGPLEVTHVDHSMGGSFDESHLIHKPMIGHGFAAGAVAVADVLALAPVAGHISPGAAPPVVREVGGPGARAGLLQLAAGGAPCWVFGWLLHEGACDAAVRLPPPSCYTARAAMLSRPTSACQRPRGAPAPCD